MKAFFLLVLLFLAFVFFASSGVGQADLNPYAAQSSGAVPPNPDVGLTGSVNPGSDVVTINNNANTAAQSNYAVPVTGNITCTNPYTVRSGDFLSSIAEACNTTVAAIRLANPTITNANLIYPGQQLVIPGASQAANTNAQPQAQQVPVTGDKNSVSPDVNVVPNTQQPAAPVTIPQTGPGPRMAAGSIVQVKAFNFPANTPASIAIGPQSAGYNVVAASITDAGGNVTTNITLPASASAATPWVVVVASTGSSTVTAMSKPFYIYTP